MAFQLPKQNGDNKGSSKLADKFHGNKENNKKTKTPSHEASHSISESTLEKHKTAIESNKHVQGQIDWIKSKRGKAMLKESYGRGWRKILKARLQNLGDTKSTVMNEEEWSKVHHGGGKNILGESTGKRMRFNSPFIEKLEEDIGDIGAHEASHSTGKIRSREEYKGIVKKKTKKQKYQDFINSDENISKTKKYSYDEYVMKEGMKEKLTTEDRGLGDYNPMYLIPKKDSDLMKNLQTGGGTDINQLTDTEYQKLVKFWTFGGKFHGNEKELREEAKVNATTQLDFNTMVARSTEVRARLNTGRHQLRKLGVDVFNKKITKKDLQKIENTREYKQLKKLYDDKGILEMFNKISANTDDLDFNLEGATNKNINYA